MKITINNKEIELKQTFRTLMLYENIASESFSSGNVTNILVYFYCNVLACNNYDQIDFDDFIDYIDANPQVLKEYYAWLDKQNKIDNIMKPISKEEKKTNK